MSSLTKKVLSVLPWVMGLLASAALIVFTAWDLWRAFLNPYDYAVLGYTKGQVSAALDTAKALLPMCTGYLIVATPVFKYLHQQRKFFRPLTIVGMSAVFGFGILAVGFWSGVFAFLIGASNAFDRPETGFSGWNNSDLNLHFARALMCARAALLCFFTSVVWFIATAMGILFFKPEDASREIFTPPDGVGS